jgi:hypothetical protein
MNMQPAITRTALARPPGRRQQEQRAVVIACGSVASGPRRPKAVTVRATWKPLATQDARPDGTVGGHHAAFASNRSLVDENPVPVITAARSRRQDAVQST